MLGGTRLPSGGGAAALPAGLPRLRFRRARLELLAEGLRRHGRGADPSRAGSGAAGLRGGPAPRFRSAGGAVAGRPRGGGDVRRLAASHDFGDSEEVREARDPAEAEKARELWDPEDLWTGMDDQQRRYPLHQEDGGESAGIGESRADTGDQRRQYPSHREDGGDSWADADEKRRRELRRQPIVPHDYPEPVAADWSDLLAIVKERVRGRRGSHSTAPWWQFERLRPELFAATAGLEHVLVIPQTSNHCCPNKVQLINHN